MGYYYHYYCYCCCFVVFIIIITIIIIIYLKKICLNITRVQRIVSNKHTTMPPTIMWTFLFQYGVLWDMEHARWNMCIVGFVRWVYRRHTQNSCHDTVHKKEQNDCLHHNTKMHAAVGQLLHGVHGEEETWRRQEGRQYGEIGGHNDDSKQPVDGDQVTHSAVCWQVNHTWNTDKHMEYRKLRPWIISHAANSLDKPQKHILRHPAARVWGQVSYSQI